MDRSILVGTRVGMVAQRMREQIALFRTAGTDPENMGICGNDLIAQRLLEALCLPGKAFVDVGAHIGSVIAGVARHSRPSAIIAIEAVPAKAEALRRRFPQAIVHSCAVGEQEGEMPFFIDLRQSGYSSLYPSSERGEQQEISVPIRRLDHLVGSERVDVIKIDVEGAELAVMRGSDSLLARDRPTIMFESGPEEVGGYSKAAMWEWLDQAGYAVLLPNRVAHIDPGLSRDGFIEAHLYPRRTTNYFAVARVRREEVRARARMIQKLV
ncbi:FkbM family methyltransferase [Sphingobium bisphenolivorans]|uniref:FkbM family methyltransferase n=1 Tax=Sphingobium bisphenolivorans TaxID=1335760 RepID=UPI0003A2F9F7|nr:FkbM family methyltransferase [Sphingobium bisphenolivorans]